MRFLMSNSLTVPERPLGPSLVETLKNRLIRVNEYLATIEVIVYQKYSALLDVDTDDPVHIERVIVLYTDLADSLNKAAKMFLEIKRLEMELNVLEREEQEKVNKNVKNVITDDSESMRRLAESMLLEIVSNKKEKEKVPVKPTKTQ